MPRQCRWIFLLALALGMIALPWTHADGPRGPVQIEDFDDADIDNSNPVSNPGIDCSTNAGYNDPYISSANKSVGAPSGRNQNCAACHQNAHPKPGQGDRPEYQFASLQLQNKSNADVNYEMKIGKNGNWKEFSMAPGKTRVVAMSLSAPGQKKSPEVFMKQDGRSRKLTPLATPNKKIGNLYFFKNASEDGKVYLYQPGKSIARR